MLIGSRVEAVGVEAMRTGTSTVFCRVTKRKRRWRPRILRPWIAESKGSTTPRFAICQSLRSASNVGSTNSAKSIRLAAGTGGCRLGDTVSHLQEETQQRARLAH